MITYFHGLESTNTGSKIMWVKDNYPNVFNPLLDYFAAQQQADFLDNVLHDVRDTELFVGSSMGGYMALHCANILQKDCFLLNPSFIYNPTKHPFSRALLPHYQSITILIGLEDQVVNPLETFRFIQKHRLNCTIHTLPNIGHQIPVELFKLYFKEWIK